MNALALLRVEYKLDLIMMALQANGLMLMPGDLPQLEGLESDICPVCNAKLRFSIDAIDEQYIRSCDCKPPRFLVAGVSDVFRNPPKSTKSRSAEADEPSDETPLRPAQPSKVSSHVNPKLRTGPRGGPDLSGSGR